MFASASGAGVAKGPPRSTAGWQVRRGSLPRSRCARAQPVSGRRGRGFSLISEVTAHHLPSRFRWASESPAARKTKRPGRRARPHGPLLPARRGEFTSYGPRGSGVGPGDADGAEGRLRIALHGGVARRHDADGVSAALDDRDAAYGVLAHRPHRVVEVASSGPTVTRSSLHAPATAVSAGRTPPTPACPRSRGPCPRPPIPPRRAGCPGRRWPPSRCWWASPGYGARRRPRRCAAAR